jgi:hypothetical protein
VRPVDNPVLRLPAAPGRQGCVAGSGPARMAEAMTAAVVIGAAAIERVLDSGDLHIAMLWLRDKLGGGQ